MMKAREAQAGLPDILSSIEKQLMVLTWMLGMNIAMNAAILLSLLQK